MTIDPCVGPGCTAACLPGSCKGRCAIGRKHLRAGGVCCGTCFESCDGCGGYFYPEHTFAVEDPTDEGWYDYYCHCCSAEGGLPWRPHVELAWGRVVAVVQIEGDGAGEPLPAMPDSAYPPDAIPLDEQGVR